jgi:zinc protease
MGGSVLATGLPGLLELMGELLTSASYPKDDVLGERDRLVQELAIYRSQPSVVAREALLHRLYGDHPYGRDLPTAEAVAGVKPSQLRSLHEKRIAPAGAVLVLVGDLAPARLIALVEGALAGWTTQAPSTKVPALTEPPAGPPLLVDRPGSVQTTIRMSRPVPSRTAPDFAAMSLANLVFGGYFSSRWVANIREDKGYTYSPHAQVEHPPAGSRLMVSADVSTPVTGASLLETWYELGRIATVPVAQEELDQARRYAIGSLALGTASQAGLASTLSLLAGAGLGVEWLRDHPKALAAVGVDDVLAAAQSYLAPTSFTSVLVGDAEQVASQVEAVTGYVTG